VGGCSNLETQKDYPSYALETLYVDKADALEDRYPDLDEDGIADEQDHCPNSRLGSVVDLHGCEVVSAAPEPTVVEAPVVAAAPVTTPPKAEIKLLPIQFEFDSAEIRADQSPQLQQDAEQLQTLSADEVALIVGHTDSIGTDAYNRTLSWQRAANSKRFLVEAAALNPDQIYIMGLGESAPVADNRTSEGRAQNRRIELQVMPREALPEEARTTLPVSF
jgi:OOP family OmpA-OmpF porin